MKAVVDEAALAESRAFNDDLVLRLAQMPAVHTLPPEVTRQGRRDGKSIFPPLEFLPQARDLTALHLQDHALKELDLEALEGE